MEDLEYIEESEGNMNEAEITELMKGYEVEEIRSKFDYYLDFGSVAVEIAMSLN